MHEEIIVGDGKTRKYRLDHYLTGHVTVEVEGLHRPAPAVKQVIRDRDFAVVTFLEPLLRGEQVRFTVQ